MAEDVVEVVDEEEGGELELVQATNLAEVLAGMSEAEVTSVQETKARIITEMLAAETEEELWKEMPTWSSKEHVGASFEVTEVRGIFQSRFENEAGVKGGFLACSAINLDTGEVGILTTSALRLAGRIGWYYQHGKLPVKLTIVQRGETAAGYPILDGERLEG